MTDTTELAGRNQGRSVPGSRRRLVGRALRRATLSCAALGVVSLGGAVAAAGPASATQTLCINSAGQFTTDCPIGETSPATTSPVVSTPAPSSPAPSTPAPSTAGGHQHAGATPRTPVETTSDGVGLSFEQPAVITGVAFLAIDVIAVGVVMGRRRLQFHRS